MLLPLAGRRLYYDLAGPEDGPVVCITHSLASDGGMLGRADAAAAAGRVPRAAPRHARAWRQRPGCRRLYDDRRSPAMSPRCSTRSRSRACIISACRSAA